MPGAKTWTNWSGSVTSRPRQIATPDSVDALSDLIRDTASSDGQLRVVGSGHSFTPVVATDHTLVSLARISGLVDVDRDTRLATVFAGTTIRALGGLLGEHDLALENQGDIDAQTIAGAVGTGTHGTGIAFGSISTQVRGLTLVLATGEQLPCSPSHEPEIFKAAQVSLGALGVLAQIRLQCVPSYVLRDVRKNVDLAACLADFEDSCRRHRHFEFWWFPYSDRAATKALDITSAPNPRSVIGRVVADKLLETGVFWAASETVRLFPGLARSVSRFAARAISEADHADQSYKIFPSPRDVRFNEMEYAVPVEQGLDCLRELKAYIEHGKIRVHFPIEYRVVAADDIWLSPFYRRDSAVISVHMYAGMPHGEYFLGCEAIFRNHRGRPHWGKIHSLTAHDFQDMYPEWHRFHEIRRRLDPRGVFMNDHLAQIFGA